MRIVILHYVADNRYVYRNISMLQIYLGIDNLSLSQGQTKQMNGLRLSFIIVFMVLEDTHMSQTGLVGLWIFETFHFKLCQD